MFPIFQKTAASQTHFGFTNMGSNTHHFSATAILSVAIILYKIQPWTHGTFICFSFFSNFFENFFTPGWRPIFGLRHSKNIDFGNGGKIQHGIQFNIGPKQKFEPDLQELEYELLGQRQPRTQKVLKSMTLPYYKKKYVY